jgi:D-beta-D-heptose 7-phosphate kinase/D-beta-D-heptose 1-phosphate adenosyltransferase
LTREEILRDLVEHHRPEGCKLLDRDHLAIEVGRRRRAGQTVVFTNGCFDLLHAGHVRLLRQARSLGDFLVVGLNSDASVRRLKGPNRPINTAAARAEVLSALESVDTVTIFDEETPLPLIAAIGPDILVKGGDYRPEDVVGRAEVEAAGGRLVLIPLVEGHSTTDLVHRAARGTVKAHPAESVSAPHLGRKTIPVGSPVPVGHPHD